jgi:hypothetical protein
MTTLDDMLRRFGLALNLDADELIAFAQEDTQTGWDRGLGDWPVGSLFASEGKVLYALTRALRPETVVEFGSLFGCSAKHILSALVANKHGKLYSIDPAPQIMLDRFTAAEKKHWVVIREEGETADVPFESAQIVLEDASHSAAMTEALIRRGLTWGARIILSHDGDHYLVGADVQNGFRRAAGEFQLVRADDSDCGFVYQVRPS